MPAFTIETSRVVDAPMEEVWPVVSDAGGYHAVVDSLEHTEIISGQGHGMVRHCVDTKGREWNETCTMWNENTSFRMTVDLGSYPASFRAIFKRVEGTWSVTPTEAGTLITLRFDGETKLGPLGSIAVAAMGRDAVLTGIMDGYEAQISQRLATDQTNR
ncbi:MAG: SRPBCC family protein [Acidimicrobiia bacterium]|nr:SRPBCC family protein [Acidimicrobiia bacterium]MDH5505542.1 SRPBCC family protein [Acidimicrobiia bacterium]